MPVASPAKISIVPPSLLYMLDTPRIAESSWQYANRVAQERLDGMANEIHGKNLRPEPIYDRLRNEAMAEFNARPDVRREVIAEEVRNESRYQLVQWQMKHGCIPHDQAEADAYMERLHAALLADPWFVAQIAAFAAAV